MRLTLSSGPFSETVIVMLSENGSVFWSAEYPPSVTLAVVLHDMRNAQCGRMLTADVSNAADVEALNIPDVLAVSSTDADSDDTLYI